MSRRHVVCDPENMTVGQQPALFADAELTPETPPDPAEPEQPEGSHE